MWIDLYILAAVVVAVTAWLVAPRFQSYDAPGDLARGFWSAAAGALWPLILVGAAQVYAVRYVARRLGPDAPQDLDLAQLAAHHEVGLRS
jgi:hypothetical protein